LPVVSAQTMESGEPQALLVTTVGVPDWLPAALSQTKEQPSRASLLAEPVSLKHIIRVWTSDLTERLYKDSVFSETFIMEILYVHHYVYLLAVLLLAFMPSSCKDIKTKDLVKLVKLPRGPYKPPLVRSLFERIVKLFKKTCEAQNLDPEVMNEAVKQLKSYTDSFPNERPKPIVSSPHFLQRKQVVDIEDVDDGKRGESTETVSTGTSSEP